MRRMIRGVIAASTAVLALTSCGSGVEDHTPEERMEKVAEIQSMTSCDELYKILDAYVVRVQSIGAGAEMSEDEARYRLAVLAAAEKRVGFLVCQR